MFAYIENGSHQYRVSNGETLLIDWGLAKRIGAAEPTSFLTSGETGHTLAGVSTGTPAYMSPEQAHGEWGRVGPLADVFSVRAGHVASHRLGEVAIDHRGPTWNRLAGLRASERTVERKCVRLRLSKSERDDGKSQSAGLPELLSDHVQCVSMSDYATRSSLDVFANILHKTGYRRILNATGNDERRA